jgi:hypothetical protein
MFGFMSSRPFSVWNKAVSGRLKSDTRLSASITYNNFPFPVLSKTQEITIGEAAEGVIAARKEFTNASLADLYNPNTMPIALRKAHDRLDSETLLAFGLSSTVTDTELLEKLFETYSGFLAKAAPKQKK